MMYDINEDWKWLCVAERAQLLPWFERRRFRRLTEGFLVYLLGKNFILFVVYGDYHFSDFLYLMLGFFARER